jgi:hypothetical protein
LAVLTGGGVGQWRLQVQLHQADVCQPATRTHTSLSSTLM